MLGLGFAVEKWPLFVLRACHDLSVMSVVGRKREKSTSCSMYTIGNCRQTTFAKSSAERRIILDDEDKLGQSGLRDRTTAGKAMLMRRVR